MLQARASGWAATSSCPEFFERGLFGFYFSVAREGDVAAGDPIVELERDPRGFRVTEVARLFARDRDDVEAMRRAAELDVLPESWREWFRQQVESREASRASYAGS